MKKLAIILHKNFEEAEAVVTIDILRRSEILIDIFNSEEKEFQIGSHGIEIKTDYYINNLKIEDYDGIIIPGGPGINNLFSEEQLKTIIKDFYHANKLIAAICGAPQLLGNIGLLKNIEIVKHPSTNQFIQEAIVLKKASHTFKNFVTGTSIGTSIDFALEIINYLQGQKQKEEIKSQLVII